MYRQAPKGQPVKPKAKEQKLFDAHKGKLKATTLSTTSRDGNHNIYLMNADGSNTQIDR